mgnify:CR=1 FL=1
MASFGDKGFHSGEWTMEDLSVSGNVSLSGSLGGSYTNYDMPVGGVHAMSLSGSIVDEEEEYNVEDYTTPILGRRQMDVSSESDTGMNTPPVPPSMNKKRK